LIGQNVEKPLNYTEYFFDLESHGIKYKVGTQTMGVNPSTSILSVSQGQELEFDVAVWIKDQKETTTHFIYATFLPDTWYEILPLCLDPVVTSLHLMTREHGLKRHYFIYAGRVEEEKLVHTFFQVPESNIILGSVFVEECTDYPH
tara:strand:+ start:2693 stop:3130 length:438 start_codon:yes stop_codon:yes gene_type:complete